MMRELGQLRIEEHAAEAVDARLDERVEASGGVTDGRGTVAEPSPDDARPEPPATPTAGASPPTCPGRSSPPSAVARVASSCSSRPRTSTPFRPRRARA